MITVPANPPEKSIIETSNVEENKFCMLYKGKYYKIFKVKVNGTFSFEQTEPFLNMSVINGQGAVNGVKVMKGNHFIIPYQFGMVKVQGNIEILASAPCWIER